MFREIVPQRLLTTLAGKNVAKRGGGGLINHNALFTNHNQFIQVRCTYVGSGLFGKICEDDFKNLNKKCQFCVKR